MFVQRSSAESVQVKGSVFNVRSNTGSNGNDDLKVGKLLQTHDAAPGNT